VSDATGRRFLKLPVTPFAILQALLLERATDAAR
jgi:CO/xanthine dehydrogenase Mo-binding subunit